MGTLLLPMQKETRTSNVGRRTSNVEWGKPAMRAEDAGGTPALHTGFADPTPGDALVPERGARRATGDRAYLSRQPTRPRMRAGTPALPGSDLTNPTAGAVAASRPGARRATGDRAYLSRQPTRPRMRAGTPALQGSDLTNPKAGAVAASRPGARRATGSPAQHHPILHSCFCILHSPQIGGEAH
jgi:hypothetical protein